MRRGWFIGVFCAALALLQCSVSSSTGGGGGPGCPCTVGNSGIHYTLACGQSACVDLNGTQTGYRCDASGATEDPSICATIAPDASALDASMPPGNDAAPLPIPDASAAAMGQCMATSSNGTCASGSCSCGSGPCAFACGPDDDAGLAIRCGANESCAVACQGQCAVSCVQSQDCNVSAGPGSTVVCVQASSCTATVGSRGSVECRQAGSCDVTCTSDCAVDCSQATSCHVHCGGDASSSCQVTCLGGVTTCPDGSKVCGSGGC